METGGPDVGLNLGAQRILFVGGKGGVGKTTSASALGLRLAERGERCLVVSTDPAHSLGDLWDRRIGDHEVELAPNLIGLEIDPDAQVGAYLDTVRTAMRDLVNPTHYPQIERQMTLARLSPGAVEAAMLERVSDLILGEESRFDRLIFDTAPTGHTLRLLSLPESMAQWTDGLMHHRDRSDEHDERLQRSRAGIGVTIEAARGTAAPGPDEARSNRIRTLLNERREKFHRVRHVLLDSEKSAFILVLNPERLPILESAKAVEALREFQIPVLALIVNRVLPMESAGEFLERRRAQEGDYLRQIDETFPGLPSVRIPLFRRDIEGLENLRRIGEYLVPPG